MAASASSRRSSGPVLRSLSPSGRFHNPHHHHHSVSSSYPRSSSGSPFASSTSSFSSRSATFFHRSASPTRVNLYGGGPSSSTSTSIRFSIDRPISPNRSISASSPRSHVVQRRGARTPAGGAQKKTCMCSPTNHPGSFRCNLHKHSNNHQQQAPYQSRLNARRSAMTNSLVRIGTVEGDLVKRALAALIRPSSHQQKRREAFQPGPSRLSAMSRAED